MQTSKIVHIFHVYLDSDILKNRLKSVMEQSEEDIIILEHPSSDSDKIKNIAKEHHVRHHFLCDQKNGYNSLDLFLERYQVLLKKYDIIKIIDCNNSSSSKNMDQINNDCEFVELTEPDILYEMKNSKSALIVKSISDSMVGKTFHHHTHILYDIRTIIGPKPITYTEIGSYEGGSMSLMLLHPYKSDIHCIDPLVVHDTQKEMIESNSIKYNKNDYNIYFHVDYSIRMNLIKELRRQNHKTDILFIDGDHDLKGVFSDFFLHLEFLTERGFIVFDDYNDATYSPDVKISVDTIHKQLPDCGFDVWKNFPNYQNAYICDNYPFFNECVFRKKSIQEYKEIPVIIIPTYFRNNGSTSEYLKRSIKSVIDQTYGSWTLIIVGDSYEIPSELNDIVSHFQSKTKNNIILLHNYISERYYLSDPRKKWNVAGAIAINMGLLYARQNGYKYYFHLDDDDFWISNHIESIMEIYHTFPSCVFAHTKSTYKGIYLPNNEMDNIEIKPNNHIPKGADVIHSSFSFRIDIIPYYYFTNFYEDNPTEPTDLLMLSSISSFISLHPEYSSIYVPKLTCHHDEEFEHY